MGMHAWYILYMYGIKYVYGTYITTIWRNEQYPYAYSTEKPYTYGMYHMCIIKYNST